MPTLQRSSTNAPQCTVRFPIRRESVCDVLVIRVHCCSLAVPRTLARLRAVKKKQQNVRPSGNGGSRSLTPSNTHAFLPSSASPVLLGFRESELGTTTRSD